MIRGAINLLGGGRSGQTLLWRSSLRPLILVRSLFAKAWKTGISTKEYLILFDLISTNFRTWDKDSRQTALVLLFLFKENRKALKDWDSSSGSLERALFRFVHKSGVKSLKKVLEGEFHLTKFLHQAPKSSEFEMKIVRSGKSKTQATKRVRSPSSVGTKHGKTGSLPIISGSSDLSLPKGLDEEIALLFSKLILLGVPESVLLENFRGINSAEESVGIDETPSWIRSKKIIEQLEKSK